MLTVARASITIGINVTLVFHRFFILLAKSNYLFFFSLFFSFLLLLVVLDSFESFSHKRKKMALNWNLRDSLSPQVSWILLSILANLNAVVWMVATYALISDSSCLFIYPWVTALSTPITTGITVTFMFHILFSSLAISSYLSLFSLSFNFTLLYAVMAKYTI